MRLRRPTDKIGFDGSLTEEQHAVSVLGLWIIGDEVRR
jgi:hypothetical protein